jgi:hypothetical protein
MDRTQIILIVALIALAAFSRYQKYKKKNKNAPDTNSKPTGTSFPSSSGKEDDYEPYSKK